VSAVFASPQQDESEAAISPTTRPAQVACLAFEQLETTIATIPAGPTYGDLLLNPYWDDLRGNPRFDKIVAAAKAASK
jgi:hypothetical protein